MVKKIRVFSTKFCAYCVSLKSFLQEHNIEFEEIDVSEDKQAGQEMIQKSGQMGVPVIEIDGQMIVGFNKEEISKLLNI